MATEVHYSRPLPPIVDPRYVKITPEELARPEHAGIKFSTIKKTKAANLSEAISILTIHAPGEGMRALYRFHTGAHALSSVAEVREQHNSLTPEQKDLLYVAHTTQNIKEVTSSGVTLYSPYISTTSNLEALIRTSFSPTTGGDRNIPQDVFARVESISAFVVPERMCKDPKLDLSIRESEVCYDSSYAPLISHRARVIENPLKRSIEVSALPLAISREDGAVHIARAAAIDRSMQELLATDPIVNPDFIARYTEIYRMREDLCATLAPMPRKPTIFKPLVHGEVVAVRMREAPTGNHASSGTAGAGVGSTRHEEDARDSCKSKDMI